MSTERRAGPDASYLDPAEIRSVELARGPGSVAYGSDAFGGVIAVQTRRPDHAAPFGVQLSSTIGGGLPEKSAHLELSSGYGTGAILSSFHARTFDDYRSPDGVVPNSAWRDAGGRVAWEHAAGTSRWSAAWQSDRGRAIGRPRSDSATIRASSPFENSNRLSASYARPAFLGFRDVRINGLSGWVSDRTQQEPANGRCRATSTVGSVVSRPAAARWVTASSTRSAFKSGRRAGAAGLRNHTTVASRDDLASSWAAVDQSAHRTGTGLFPRLTPDRGVCGVGRPPSERCTTRTPAGQLGSRSVANGALAGLGAVTVAPIDSMTVTAQIARGFRDPTLSDRFYRGPVGRGFIEGNPTLTPETSVQFDLVARYATSRLRLGGAFYDYRITDLIERYAVGATNLFTAIGARPTPRQKRKGSPAGLPSRGLRRPRADGMPSTVRRSTTSHLAPCRPFFGTGPAAGRAHTCA